MVTTGSSSTPKARSTKEGDWGLSQSEVWAACREDSEQRPPLAVFRGGTPGGGARLWGAGAGCCWHLRGCTRDWKCGMKTETGTNCCSCVTIAGAVLPGQQAHGENEGSSSLLPSCHPQCSFWQSLAGRGEMCFAQPQSLNHKVWRVDQC